MTHDSVILAALLRSGELRDFLVQAAGLSRYHILASTPHRPGLAWLLSFPEDSRGAALSVPPDAPLLQLFGSTELDQFPPVKNGPVVPAGSALHKEAFEQLARLGARHAFPLRLGGATVGLLLVEEIGEGPGGPAQQIESVRLFVRHLNALLGLCLAAESPELLGRLSRGLAHDLRGWLTPVSACLQLWNGGDSRKAEALRPTAFKNLEAIQSCLEQARYFSQHGSPRLELTALPQVLRKSVELVESNLTARRVSVAIHAPSKLEAEVDEVLMLRLLTNLLTNAIRATPPGGEVRMDLEESPPEEQRHGMVRLRIVNPGSLTGPLPIGPAAASGMEPADSPSREEAGWGLGLRICREIVHLHQGRLHVFSSGEPPVTTAQVDLPRLQDILHP